jgi:hypothetical protein
MIQNKAINNNIQRKFILIRKILNKKMQNDLIIILILISISKITQYIKMYHILPYKFALLISVLKSSIN